MLVVVAIMMILVAFVLPRLQPAMGQRRVRETARMVEVFLSRARATAIETGRPCGVLFQRADDSTEDALAGQISTSTMMQTGCTTLFQVETPPPYAGDTSGAVIRVKDYTTDPPPGAPYLSDPPGCIVLRAVIRMGDLSDGIIRYGDLIQLNHQGPWYEICEDPNASGSIGANFQLDGNGCLMFSVGQDPEGDGWIDTHWLTLRRIADGAARTPWPKWDGSAPLTTASDPSWSAPVPFTILRRPVPTIAAPLRLPSGMVVDLGGSGHDMAVDPSAPVGPVLLQYRDVVRFRPGTRGVTIMFSPEGPASRYYDDNSPPEGEAVTEPLLFLVGRASQLNPEPEPGGSDNLNYAVDPDAPDEQKANWQLLTNLWVTISPQTGMVSVNENAATPTWNGRPLSDRQNCLSQLLGIDEARKFAKQARSMGGR